MIYLILEIVICRKINSKLMFVNLNICMQDTLGRVRARAKVSCIQP